MSKPNKRPHLAKVIHAANRCGLFVLADGVGRNFKYEFWSRSTGKIVLVYYPDSGHWMFGSKDGTVSDYREALDQVSTEHRRDTRAERDKPAHLRQPAASLPTAPSAALQPKQDRARTDSDAKRRGRG